MLKQHGDFKTVEVEVQKISIQTSKNEVEGGWENEISLAQKGWTEQHNCTLEFRAMYDCALQLPS